MYFADMRAKGANTRVSRRTNTRVAWECGGSEQDLIGILGQGEDGMDHSVAVPAECFQRGPPWEPLGLYVVRLPDLAEVL